jgi:hypothetical protein
MRDGEEKVKEAMRRVAKLESGWRSSSENSETVELLMRSGAALW